MSTRYIAPPKRCKWNRGSPPAVGWYPASTTRSPNLLRWWNGRHWSWAANHCSTKAEASIWARIPASVGDQTIYWAEPWWLKGETK